MEYPFGRHHGLNSYLLLQYFVLKFVDGVFHSLLFLRKFDLCSFCTPVQLIIFQ